MYVLIVYVIFVLTICFTCKLSFCAGKFCVTSASTCLRAVLARPTRHINVGVMAAPPDAESLESRISEYFKTYITGPVLPQDPHTHKSSPASYFSDKVTARHTNACPRIDGTQILPSHPGC